MEERKGCSGFLGRIFGKLFSEKRYFVKTRRGVRVELTKDQAGYKNAQQFADKAAEVALSQRPFRGYYDEVKGKFVPSKNQ